MSNYSPAIDYISTHFEYPVLTKITDQITYAALKKIKNELKANAGKVQSDLGGGAHGHLGQVLNGVEYTTVSPVPYVMPGHPGPLVIPNGSTQYQIQHLRDQHRENTRVY